MEKNILNLAKFITASQLAHERRSENLVSIVKYISGLHSADCTFEHALHLEFIAILANTLSSTIRAEIAADEALVSELENQERFAFDIHAGSGH